MARREHAAEVTALEARGDRSAAAAAAAGSRAAAKLRKLEKTVRAGREMVLAAAERAAARREDARRALHERLADIGAEHARAVDAMVRRAEAAAAAETSRYERAGARDRLARSAEVVGRRFVDDGARASRRPFQRRARRVRTLRGGRGDARASRRRSRRRRRRLVSFRRSRRRRANRRKTKKQGEATPTSTTTTASLSVPWWRSRCTAWCRRRRWRSSARERRRPPRMVTGPARMPTRTAFLGTTRQRSRARSRRLDAAWSTSGALGSAADDRGVRLWRTVAQAYAAKLALASEDAREPTAEDEARATELEGPAAVFACVVAADDDVVAAWDRTAPRWRRGPVATSAVFARGRALLKYVVHVSAATTTASASRTSRSRTDAAAMDAADAAELRSLEARAEAEVRQFRYDAWRAADREWRRSSPRRTRSWISCVLSSRKTRRDGGRRTRGPPSRRRRRSKKTRRDGGRRRRGRTRRRSRRRPVRGTRVYLRASRRKMDTCSVRPYSAPAVSAAAATRSALNASSLARTERSR